MVLVVIKELKVNEMKRNIILLIICILSIRFSFTLMEAHEYRQEKEAKIHEVEQFFAENGYEIIVKGAYMGGRESEGPFLYGWYWEVFDIGTEEILLYYFEDKVDVEGYLINLDEKRRGQCHLSSHFVFWYYGETKDIIETIDRFCEQY